MARKSIEGYGPKRITTIVARGSLYVAIALTGLLLTYDIFNHTLIRSRFWLACGVILYLIFIRVIIRKGKINTANWLLIALYEALAACVLIYWGLSSAVGILSASFAILLPGVLMAPRYIPPVAFITFGLLIATYTLHVTGIIEPTIYIPASPSSLLDVIAYTTILGVFALVSWISARQSSLSLTRALRAEAQLQKQKDALAVELERESARLRQTQLQQIQQLYRFAVMGQSATATLHELSNHLSILNLDIDDIKQQYKYSKAIANAEEGIEYINRMVRKSRTQLNAQNQARTFNALPVISRVVNDMQPKFQQRQLKLVKSTPKGISSFPIHGDSMSLMQCISILLNNALDACAHIPHAKVHVAVTVDQDNLRITVADTGPGIDPSIRKTLFEPLESTKPSGLGVGLYIAKHIVEAQLDGTLVLQDTKHGASFQITLNRYKKS